MSDICPYFSSETTLHFRLSFPPQKKKNAEPYFREKPNKMIWSLKFLI